MSSGLREKTRPLPVYSDYSSSSAVEEKRHRRNGSAGAWSTTVTPSLLRRVYRRFGRVAIVLVVLLILLVWLLLPVKTRKQGETTWTSQSDPHATLLFRRDELRRIWEYEIASGHYPSSAEIPPILGFQKQPLNPAVPPKDTKLAPIRPPATNVTEITAATPGVAPIGVGPQRIYLDVQSTRPNLSYPPRPLQGTIADLDVIMKHCNFDTNKYVRDCLEVLRRGAGLDNGRRIRRGEMEDWKYIYTEKEDPNKAPYPTFPHTQAPSFLLGDEEALVPKRLADTWGAPLTLGPAPIPHTHASLSTPCDEDNPRVFHIYWTGPFTDKPYTALLSFLYTQNLGLNLDPSETAASHLCRPAVWMWINPGTAHGTLSSTATRDMYEQLKGNAWASPFLHPRFHDVIQFKMWNTTEQLDAVPEMTGWRALRENMFNSEGHVYKIPKEDPGDGKKPLPKDEGDEQDDRLSVVLSDMVRFILLHRFGGIYLDADNMMLRDWQELWGWKGAFAYRWSRLPTYNTAVLKMSKGSALTKFIIRSAMENGWDFHPMSVHRYTADAGLDQLLLRLPDALFDSAWLSTEDFQRDRPPFPYLSTFAEFFETPAGQSAAPQQVGFDGFFRGAYGYHWHNSWKRPFDRSRNWPDLGPKFIQGEREVRKKLYPTLDPETWEDHVADDRRDLDWSAVLKRQFEAFIRGEVPNMYGEWLVW